MQEFQYLVKQRNFVIQVGQIISHSLNLERYSINEINELNRISVAEEILSKVHYSYFEGFETVGKGTLLIDLAIYIDDKLPKSYVKKHDEKYGGKGLKNIPNKILDNYGLKLQGAEKIKNNNFSSSKIIDEYTSNYQNSPTVNNESDKKAPQDNYQLLTSYLRSNSIDVSKTEFTAILRTMNDLKNSNHTKAYVLKKHSSSLNVPQSRITKHLKDMNFVSERTQQNKNSYLQKEAIAMKRLESRLIREDNK